MFRKIVSDEKNNKCTEISGKNTSGWLYTNSKKGKLNTAPPKPRPERTKPLQIKIRPIDRYCQSAKSVIRYCCLLNRGVKGFFGQPAINQGASSLGVFCYENFCAVADGVKKVFMLLQVCHFKTHQASLAGS